MIKENELKAKHEIVFDAVFMATQKISGEEKKFVRVYRGLADEKNNSKIAEVDFKRRVDRFIVCYGF